MVKILLNKDLCKDEQLSDWRMRPLRKSQIAYAANDVFSLIDCFKRISTILLEDYQNTIYDFCQQKKLFISNDSDSQSSHSSETNCSLLNWQNFFSLLLSFYLYLSKLFILIIYSFFYNNSKFESFFAIFQFFFINISFKLLFDF